MAIIPQILWSWEEDINDLGDLKRLQIVLDTIPDNILMGILDKERGNGRDDYPVRAMWNLVIAGVVFEHKKVSTLLRELYRNKQLAYICGFGFSKLPEAHNMSRFLTNLLKHEEEIGTMFEELREYLYQTLPGYGKELAIDSKWVESAANQVSKRKDPDGRSETEARKGVKKYYGVKEDGTAWEKVVTCFGFKIHLIVDAVYELPVAYEITDAAASDVTEGKKIIDNIKTSQPDILSACEHFMGDKGYDDTELIKELKENGIKAVIDKRSMWKTETEKVVPGYDRAYYDEAGNVYCYSPEKGERRRMALNGYEETRDALRFKCPAQAYGVKCQEICECNCRNIRIPLSTDQRIFTQVQRESYKWERLYNKRTAVERVNSRLDVSYGFEERRTRGLARTKLYVGLAMLVMLAFAVWHVKNNQIENVRSMVRVS